MKVIENRKEFKEHVKFAAQLLHQYDKKGDKRKKDLAWKVLTDEILYLARGYEDIQSPQMKLKCLNMVNEGTAFSDRKESVLQLNRAIEELQKFDNVP